MYVLSDSLITLFSIFTDMYSLAQPVEGFENLQLSITMLMLEDEEVLVGDDVKLGNIP